MQVKTMAELNYPSPLSSKQNSPQKKLIAIIAIIVIAVVVIGIVAYIATNPSSTSPSTSPNASSTTGQTASPYSSPSGQSFAGFRAGAWANYTITNYDESGVVSEETPMGYAIGEATYNGVACWLLKVEMQMTDGSGVTMMRMTYWINKNTNEGIHAKTQMYTNGELIFENEEDINPSDEDYELPTEIDPSTIVGQEKIMVPAGTFDCQKATTTSTYSGIISVSNVWVNSNIPVMGWVKEQTTQNGILSSVIELVSYGG